MKGQLNFSVSNSKIKQYESKNLLNNKKKKNTGKPFYAFNVFATTILHSSYAFCLIFFLFTDIFANYSHSI